MIRLITVAWALLIIFVGFSLVALLQSCSTQSLDWNVTTASAFTFYTPNPHHKPTPRPCRIVREQGVTILFCNRPMETLEGNVALRKHPNWSCDPRCHSVVIPKK